MINGHVAADASHSIVQIEARYPRRPNGAVPVEGRELFALVDHAKQLQAELDRRDEDDDDKETVISRLADAGRDVVLYYGQRCEEGWDESRFDKLLKLLEEECDGR